MYTGATIESCTLNSVKLRFIHKCDIFSKNFALSLARHTKVERIKSPWTVFYS